MAYIHNQWETRSWGGQELNWWFVALVLVLVGSLLVVVLDTVSLCIIMGSLFEGVS